jgi:hypothetical protein
MPTKKKPDPPMATDPSRVERGRYARLLADGYVVEVEPAKPPRTKPVEPAVGPVTPTR